MQDYRNCYIRPSAKNTEPDQRDAIAATGPMAGRQAKTQVDTDGKGLDALLKTTRKGDLFVVAELQCLGDDLPAVMAALRKIQNRGLVVLEAATGRLFSKPFNGPAAGIAADDYFRRRALSTMAARKAGKKGAKARWCGLPGRVPLAEAVKRWNEAVDAGATADEAIAAVNEGYERTMSYDTLQRLRRAGKLPKALRRLPSGRRRQT